MTLAGNEKRVVVIELDLSDIWRRVELATIGQAGFAYAVSGKGIIITHRDAAMVGTELAPAVAPLLKGFEGFTTYNQPSDNNSVFAAYSPVGGAVGWGIVVEQDSAEAMAPLYRTAAFVGGVWLLLEILGTIVILFMVKNLGTIYLSDLTQECGGTVPISIPIRFTPTNATPRLYKWRSVWVVTVAKMG